MSYRLPNNVKSRRDGRGSFFGQLHRQALTSNYYMHDLDYIGSLTHSGQRVLGCGEDTLFLEYRMYRGFVRHVVLFEVKWQDNAESRKALDVDSATTKSLILISKKLGVRFIVVFESEGKLPLRFYEYSHKSNKFDYLAELHSADNMGIFWRERLNIYD